MEHAFFLISSLTAYFPLSFASLSIYKFLHLQNPSLVKKQSSNKNASVQIHFTYLQLPEIPKLGQNSFLCPTHPVKKETNAKGQFIRLEIYPSDNALPPLTTKKKSEPQHSDLVLVKLRVIVLLAEVLDLCKPKPYLLTSSSQLGSQGQLSCRNAVRHAQVLLTAGKTEISKKFAQEHAVSQ